MRLMWRWDGALFCDRCYLRLSPAQRLRAERQAGDSDCDLCGL